MKIFNKKSILLMSFIFCGCNNASQSYDSAHVKSNCDSIQDAVNNENFEEKVITLINKREYEQAYKLVANKVENNDSKAENLMGILYLNGFGVEKNQNQALQWFEKSIKNDGNPSSYYNVAAILMGYPETKRDLKKIFEYNSRAVTGKYPDAYNLQGILYLNGIYVDKDEEMALTLFLDGAKLGSRSSQYNLASMYQNGVNKDLGKAYYWYKKAHEQDNPLATIKLASLYANGQYVEKDLDKAIQLLYPIKDDIDVAGHNFRLYCSKTKVDKCYE